MRILSSDERYLQRALELARNATAFASPNPTVGCVLVRDGAVLGEGAHFYDESDHAEIAALKQTASEGLSAANATAYVTLEPCAHHGRTGPCAAALVAAGLERCVVATVDPNPLVSGKGIGSLRDGGVTVDVVDAASPLALAARRLNDAFAFSIQHGRPFVTLKAAVSLDGYLAPPPLSRSVTHPHWLTGEAARADVQKLRHASDAILTGVGTILADDPCLTDRTELPRRKPLLRVILDSQLRTPPASALVKGAERDVLIIASRFAPEAVKEALESAGVEVLRVANSGGRADLPSVLKALQDRGVRNVLVEAGSTVNESFLASGLVDKVALYYSDVELGHGSVPFAGAIASPYALQQSLTHVTRETFPHAEGSTREDVKVSGYLHDPWDWPHTELRAPLIA